ncbi:uncharacterized protein [Chelonus insularis]|uniref:uncharacterized protein isoform X2 n=1 Tax=Chelonus insularis TaxID=460826 RepID=UPI00158967A4|nr:uncharacterized protein LOC118067082 isoform X2 [Chelonus insularis]
MLIVTLIPLILAARLNYPASSWKDGEKAKVTYMIHDQAIKTYFTSSNQPDEVFNLKALLTCQLLRTGYYCYFHDVDIKTILADEKPNANTSMKFMSNDSYLKKLLEQDDVLAETRNQEYMVIWVPKDIEALGRNVITALFQPLNLGLNFQSQLTGNFETKSDTAGGRCKARFLVTRSAEQNEGKNSDMEFFLISRPEEPLDRPLEIFKKVDEKCANDHLYMYSPAVSREYHSFSTNIKIDTHSVEGFTIITRNNISSYGKNVFSITNNQDQTKYLIDESLSVTLYSIEEIKCDEVKNEDDCIDERIAN